MSQAAGKRALMVLQLSDMHLLNTPSDTFFGLDTAASFQQVLDLAITEHPQADLLLLTGDLAQTPSANSYQRLQTLLAPYGIPAICLPGNHDNPALMRQMFATDPMLSFSRHTLLGDWSVVCLNSAQAGSPGGHLGHDELAFLEDCLCAYPRHPTLVAVHHHCLPIGCRWLDAQRIDNADALLAILARHPQVRAITGGHVHQEAQLTSGALDLYSVPSTCFQFAPDSDYYAIAPTPPGYRWLRLQPNGRIVTAVSRLAKPLGGLQADQSGY